MVVPHLQKIVVGQLLEIGLRVEDGVARSAGERSWAHARKLPAGHRSCIQRNIDLAPEGQIELLGPPSWGRQPRMCAVSPFASSDGGRGAKCDDADRSAAVHVGSKRPVNLVDELLNSTIISVNVPVL